MEPSRHRLTGWWGWGVQGALPPSLLLQSTATGWDAGNANGDLKGFKKRRKEERVWWYECVSDGELQFPFLLLSALSGLLGCSALRS